MPALTVLTEAQQFELLQALKSCPHTIRPCRHSKRNLLLGMLMLDAGLRVGELIKLSRSTLTVTITQTQTLYLGPDITKTEIPRTIPIGPRLLHAIAAYLNIAFSPTYHHHNDWAFPGTTLQAHLSVRQVQYIIQQAGHQAFSLRLKCHALRHTFATRLMRTTSTRIVQELLGHKCLASTQIYTHPTSTDLRDAIKRMDNRSQPNLPNEELPQPDAD